MTNLEKKHFENSRYLNSCAWHRANGAQALEEIGRIVESAEIFARGFEPFDGFALLEHLQSIVTTLKIAIYSEKFSFKEKSVSLKNYFQSSAFVISSCIRDC